MAHILVADDDPVIPELLSQVLEDEGHWVTCVSDLWQLLSMARGTLHPMIVMFHHSMTFIRPDADTDEHPLTMILRNEADLRRHKLIELYGGAGAVSPELQAIYDRLGVQQLAMPFSLDEVIGLVDRLAQELEPAT